jgi:ferredoxin-type protein NapG
MTATPPKNKAARRQFLFDSAKMVCGVGMLGLGLGLYAAIEGAAGLALRPPGACPRPTSSAPAIRCGLCVRDCPYNTLELARPEEPVATGTPYFTARNIPARCATTSPASRLARPRRWTMG